MPHQEAQVRPASANLGGQWARSGRPRYLIAERYGLRMGVDLAYGDDEVTIYISVGTGWMRP